MEAKEYIKYLVDKIHTVTLSGVTSDNKPITCAIDLMDSDDDAIYFLIARGRSMYDILKENPNISLTGIKPDNSMESISLSGTCVELGSSRLPELFDKNPYMFKLYPTMFSRDALTVFKVQNIRGEFLDLSMKPILKDTFSFGIVDKVETGYYVDKDECISCRICIAKCPEGCIDFKTGIAHINEDHCLECGNCYDLCPVGAIIKRG